MLIIYFVNYNIAQRGDADWLHTIGWRQMFASEMIPAGLFLVALFFVPETPRYLVMRGREEKALKVLRKTTGNNAEKEMESIRESLKEKSSSMRAFFLFMLDWLILFVAGFIILKLCKVNSALEISLLVSFLISLIVPIRNYGIGIVVVGVLLASLQQFIGINVVLYYAPEIFKTMGAATDTALMQQIIVGAVNLTFTIIAILTVDKFGRRPLMIVGALVMALSMCHVVGTGLLGAAFRNLPEFHPLHGDECRRGLAMDFQLPGFLDVPDARQKRNPHRDVQPRLLVLDLRIDGCSCGSLHLEDGAGNDREVVGGDGRVLEEKTKVETQ